MVCMRNLEQKSSMVDLGGALDATGSVSSELNRRLGLARSDFKNLERVWKHANSPQRWFAYGLAEKGKAQETGWLSCKMSAKNP